MKACLITFRNVTPAQRGENLLRQNGIESVLQRTPRWMEEQGCGYSLRIRCQDAAAALQLLRGQQISYRKLYLHRENGSLEELQA